MTLAQMIAAHDETALAALTSMGAVRRAKRGFDAGKARVESRDAKAAMVLADGKNVMIPAAGLTVATCDCPAVGICRHILLATFALREDTSVLAAPVVSAMDALHALDEAGLRKFAGADWDKAINLARISGQATVTQDGANLSVQLPDVECAVMFVSDQGLASAVFKGAKTTKRRVTAAAALVVRQHSGAQALDQLTQDEDQSEQMSAEFLTQVQSAIAALTTGVFGGGAMVAEDLVFDLSISARAQAAPRLTALLRGLVQQSRQQRSHHIGFREDRFLADAARAYALAKALEQHPEDTKLTGTLRRHYGERDDLDLLLIGAVRWAAASGARGLRLYAYAPSEGLWYTTGQARGDGMDPSFAPSNVYDAPLWSDGIARKLIGTRVHLKQPRVSADNQITWDHGAATLAPMPNLITAGVAFEHWAAARADIAKRSPVGLRSMGAPVPILLAPSHIGEVQFRDLDQCYEVTLEDRHRDQMTVTISADQYDMIEWLQGHQSKVHGMLCEVTTVDLQQKLTLITVLIKSGRAPVEVMNLTLDQLPQKKTAFGARTLSVLKSKIRPSSSRPSTQPTGQVQQLCSAVFDATAETLRFGQSQRLQNLSQRADALQLALMCEALRELSKEPTAVQALKVSYLSSQIILAA